MVRVVAKNDPSKARRAKHHANKGYARVAVISTLPVGVLTGKALEGKALEGKAKEGEQGSGKKRTAKRKPESSPSSSLSSLSDRYDEWLWNVKPTGVNPLSDVDMEGYGS